MTHDHFAILPDEHAGAETTMRHLSAALYKLTRREQSQLCHAIDERDMGGWQLLCNSVKAIKELEVAS